MKTEPSVYSIDDLKRDGQACWEGVRNYQARNYMRDAMNVADKVLFYHSNAKPAGIVGVAEIVKEAYADSYAWDKKSKYYDPKSTPHTPRWFMVDVGYVETFPRIISLEELKAQRELRDMLVVRRGQRLSIQPLEKKHFDHVLQMAKSLSKSLDF